MSFVTVSTSSAPWLILLQFLSVLADRNVHIAQWKKAVEGISGAAVLYLIFAVGLTCCLGGISFLAFLAIVLDVLFAGAMIAVAVMARSGASSCKGIVHTPIGTGPANSKNGFGQGFGEGSQDNVTYSVHLGLACRLNTAAFAVSIIAAFLFLVTAALQIALVRHHKKEKRYGPSPANNYTSGYGKRRWGRKNKTTRATKDAELGTVGGAAAADTLSPKHPDVRPSHETGYTGSTVAAPGTGSYDKVDGHQSHLPHGTHGGYYTQPTGTGANPYGYENNTHNNYTTGTATNY
jgi:hypothetical protein